jgi:hypothetical protein
MRDGSGLARMRYVTIRELHGLPRRFTLRNDEVGEAFVMTWSEGFRK